MIFVSISKILVPNTKTLHMEPLLLYIIFVVVMWIFENSAFK